MNRKLKDELKLSELFKTATETLFKDIQYIVDICNKNSKNKLSITIYDVKYENSWNGLNSSVKFKVSERHDWLFGIWWDKLDNDELKAEVFGQYEEGIDKFKPSASAYCEEYIFGNSTAGDPFRADGVYDMLKFVITEPYLAFYRDQHYCDYNYEHITRQKAKSSFERYRKWKDEDSRLINEFNSQAVEKIRQIFKKYINNNNAFFVDEGEFSSPRYNIIVNNGCEDLNIDLGKKGCGCVMLHNLCDYDILDRQMVREYKDWVERVEKEASKKNHSLYDPFGGYAMVVSEERFNGDFRRYEDIDLSNWVE